MDFEKKSRLLHLRSKKCRKEYTDEEYMAFQQESKKSRPNKSGVTKKKYRKKHTMKYIQLLKKDYLKKNDLLNLMK